ncbi:MAG TPA: 6-bladed beta-propeller [Longimicrobiales bacterium]|nr:6-bladed beta-propeller [Longimicrobiales bacterium]
MRLDPLRNRLRRVSSLAGTALALAGCGSPERAADGWAGTTDTLPSGQVVVRNTAEPVWAQGRGWRVEEELRLGRVEGTGPDMFGRIVALEVDGGGRLWVFDGQSQELRVFDASGAHVRTIGRRGGGPGEFAQGVHVEQGPDGHMWVMDPQNNRVSRFDTAGEHLGARPAAGGFVIMPWPGGFDAEGHYYAPFFRRPDGEFRLALVRHDAALVPLDTLDVPDDPVARGRFEHRSSGGGRMVAGIPFQGGLTWRLTERGTILGMLTDEYRLFELNAAGDTLRTITRDYTPLPVTPSDRAEARRELEWFTRQGGRIDLSKLPPTKPAATTFFEDDEGHLWVERVTAPGNSGSAHDVFDPGGRFLGKVTLPFALSQSPAPILRDGILHGVTRDDLGVQYVVRGRVVKPGGSGAGGRE